MSTNPANPGSPAWADWLVANRRLVERALLGLTLLAAVLPLVLGIKHGRLAFGPVFFWGCGLSLTFFLAALWSMASRTQNVTPSEKARLLVMGTFGVAGLLTAVLGVVLPFATYAEQLGKLESWGENIDAVAYVVLANLGGLALMFASLLAVRGMERGNQTVRWLVYGFNAFLGAVLLGYVLGLLNLLPYTEPVDQAFGRVFSREFDYTREGIYTLSDRTQAYLDGLEEPVKAYLVLSGDRLDRNYEREVTTLLANLKARSRRFDWQLVSAQSRANRELVSELVGKYAIKESGILLIAGDEKGKHSHDFIPFRKLVTEKPDPRTRQPEEVFNGENAVLGTMKSLVEGSVTIYFTQGHGEMSLERSAKPPAGGRPGEESMQRLRDRLVKDRARFEAKPFVFSPTLKAIPDDASTVVIARPTQPFSKRELDMLRDYMARKETRKEGKVVVAAGRLLVLIDPVVQKDGGGSSLAKTGLEAFLGEFGVKVGDNRVQSLSRGESPTEILCTTNPESPNPVGRAFHASPVQFARFFFENVRTVGPASAPAAGLSVVPLMQAEARNFVWPETDFGRNPVEVAANMRRAAQAGDERPLKVLSEDDLPVAVTVTKGDAPPPRDPRRRPPPPSGEEKPMMVVFGAASWLSDPSIGGGQGNLNFSLFASSLSWLREQGDIGNLVEPRQLGTYTLTVPAAEQGRLVWMPLALLLMGAIALGVGVWVVRRR